MQTIFNLNALTWVSRIFFVIVSFKILRNSTHIILIKLRKSPAQPHLVFNNFVL